MVAKRHLKMSASRGVHFAVAGALLIAPPPASAQAYPARTIRLIASQAPGGGIDTVGPSAASSINAGRLRALAVTTLRRSKLFPELPPLAEAGVPGYEAHSWYGFVVPARTPPSIVTRLNKEIVQILNRPDAGEAVLKTGLEVWTSTPETFGAYIKSEYDKWGRIIREAGITAN